MSALNWSVMPFIVDSDSAEKWVVAAMEQFGMGFHPDTLAEQYVNGETGRRLITSRSEQKWFNGCVQLVFTLCDPYEVALGWSHSQIRMVR